MGIESHTQVVGRKGIQVLALGAHYIILYGIPWMTMLSPVALD
jgi:hypothetical protein